MNQSLRALVTLFLGALVVGTFALKMEEVEVDPALKRLMVGTAVVLATVGGVALFRKRVRWLAVLALACLACLALSLAFDWVLVGVISIGALVELVVVSCGIWLCNQFEPA